MSQWGEIISEGESLFSSTRLLLSFNYVNSKGQLISKRFFEVVDFLRKMNKNKSHTSKNEFFRSFFGGNR